MLVFAAKDVGVLDYEHARQTGRFRFIGRVLVKAKTLSELKAKVAEKVKDGSVLDEEPLIRERNLAEFANEEPYFEAWCRKSVPTEVSDCQYINARLGEFGLIKADLEE